MHGETIKFN